DLPGIMLIEGDFLDPEMTTHLQTLTPGQFDLITCDMAANSTGHANTDHLRADQLAEAVVAFMQTSLGPGGGLVMKVFSGGLGAQTLDIVKARFHSVRHYKPAASRKNSAELYLVAKGFYGQGKLDKTA
ncbi:MAG: FtsJ-like methyltransferase family protein, partial [Pseudomonadota bacterium]